MRSLVYTTLFLIVGFSISVQAQYDGIYYYPDDDYDYVEQTTEFDDGNTYITNNYYDLDDDFEYSTRIRRFSRPFFGFGYYSGCYLGAYDPFYYDYYDPFYSSGWSWSLGWSTPFFSFHIGNNWGWRSHYRRPYRSCYVGGWDYHPYPRYHYNSWAYGGNRWCNPFFGSSYYYNGHHHGHHHGHHQDHYYSDASDHNYYDNDGHYDSSPRHNGRHGGLNNRYYSNGDRTFSGNRYTESGHRADSNQTIGGASRIENSSTEPVGRNVKRGDLAEKPGRNAIDGSGQTRTRRSFDADWDKMFENNRTVQSRNANSGTGSFDRNRQRANNPDKRSYSKPASADRNVNRNHRSDREVNRSERNHRSGSNSWERAGKERKRSYSKPGSSHRSESKYKERTRSERSSSVKKDKKRKGNFWGNVLEGLSGMESSSKKNRSSKEVSRRGNNNSRSGNSSYKGSGRSSRSSGFSKGSSRSSKSYKPSGRSSKSSGKSSRRGRN